MTERSHVELTWASLWRIALFVGAIFLFYFARASVGVLLIAIVISLGLDPIIDFLQRRKIPRLLGTLITFLFGFFILAVVVYFLLPVVIFEVGSFIAHFNSVISGFVGFALPQAFVNNLTLTIDQILSVLNLTNISITGTLGSVIANFVYVTITIVASFYLTVDEDGVDRMLKVVVPGVYERSVATVFGRFKTKIRRWFAAQLALSLIMGVVVGLGLWILGVKYALALGVIAALFELVPMIGPVITGLVSFLVAVSDSVSLGLYAVIFFFVIQQIEGNVLVPYIMGRAMNAHPVIVIVSMLAGAQIAGFVGIILSVPAAVLIQEIFNSLAERKDRRPQLDI